jgi:hypothetical protein
MKEPIIKGSLVTHINSGEQGIVAELNGDIAKVSFGGDYWEWIAIEDLRWTKISDHKPSNPKDAIGSGKLPLHLWPATASALGSLGLLDGMLKYGRSNWRVAGVRASIYVDAAQRHLAKWFEGQDNDADSGLPHFAHALACLAILVDAQAAGKLNDDRMVAGGYLEMLDALTPHVARLKELHAAKAPKHYTIADTAMSEHAARETDARQIAESNAEVKW